jgi:hypothetical protein
MFDKLIPPRNSLSKILNAHDYYSPSYGLTSVRSRFLHQVGEAAPAKIVHEGRELRIRVDWDQVPGRAFERNPVFVVPIWESKGSSSDDRLQGDVAR